LEVGELFPAVQSAETAVKLNPTWAEGHQTLGRTQISMGEIEMVNLQFTRFSLIFFFLSFLSNQSIKSLLCASELSNICLYMYLLCIP